MKIGIVGSGFVGSTTAYALIMQGVGSEIVLVDRNERRARAEAEDLLHAVPFANSVKVAAGGYADLAGCQAVVLSAGVGQKPGETRLQLLTRNAAVFREVVSSVLTHAPEALLVVASNPVDVMTQLTAQFAQPFGVPASRVVGSGTMLDTARFRVLLAKHFDIASRHVHGYVVGEHGDSEVLTWSLANIAGMPLVEAARLRGVDFNDELKAEIDHGVRRAAYSIIEGKGATYYGIGSALARLLHAVQINEHAVLTITAVDDACPGCPNTAVSLPRIVGAEGVVGALPLPLEPQETAALTASAQIIREAVDSIPTS